MNIKTLVLAGSIAAFSLGGVANANIILTTGTNIIEDDNIEYVYGADAEIGENWAAVDDRKTSGTLEVGDRLASFISMTQVLDGDNNQIQDLTGDIQLTGFSVIMVESIDANGNITFAAAPEFEAIYGDGATAALYTNDTGNFAENCHLADTCLADATSGDLWMIAGFGDPDDFWVSTGGNVDLSVAAALGGATSFASAQLSLSILANYTGYEFGQVDNSLIQTLLFGAVAGDGLVDIVGSGTLLGGQGLTNGYIARSDFDFEVYRVPVPGTLLLMGLGLFGIGFLASRRRVA
jgi:hypothetical protein